MKAINSMEWYLREYGEDWAEIIREEDIRLAKLDQNKPSKRFDKSTSWAFNEESGQ